jgi:glycosyltransferase involved in cell wall biosynthesis
MNELVSILIAVRDGARYLGEALASALDQPGATVEVVVVDDGSTDDSAEIARSFGKRVHVLRQEPLGIGPARNAAIEASAGTYLSFLDADDRFTPRKSASQLELLRHDPDLEAVFGHMRQFISPDVPEQARAVRVPTEVGPVVTPTTMLIRRDAFDRVGPFPAIPIAVSIDWTLRAKESGLRFVMLDEVVTERRIHDRNVGIQRKQFASQRLHVLKASLDRRRAK